MRIAVSLLLFAATLAAQDQDAAALVAKGIAAHSKGDLLTAVKDYRLALDKDPGLTRARINLSAALAESGQIDDAIAVLEAAPAKDRSNPEVRLNLALAYHGKDKLPAAIAELEKLPAAQRTDLHIVSILADSYLRTGAADKALDVLLPAVKAHPGNADLQYQTGMALIRAGHPDQALDPLEKAAKLSNSAEAWLLAGATALDVGQFQRARAALESALRLNPEIPAVFTWVGMARDRVSDEDGAKEAFRRALERDPRDFEANLHLGAILYRERDLPAAKPFLEKAVAIQPQSTLALYAIALVRAGTGEEEQAVKDLEKVTKAAPDWAEPHVKLASLYYRTGRDADGEKERAVVERLKSENREQKVSFPALEGP